MTMITPFEWIKVIDPSLKKMDTFPLTGNAPPYDWKQLSSALAAALDRSDFSIEPSKMNWREAHLLYDGMGEDLITYSFSISPLEGQVYWVLPKKAAFDLSTWFLTPDLKPDQLNDPALLNSLYDFLILEACYQAYSVFSDKALTPLLRQKQDVFKESALCWDVLLKIAEKQLVGRLVLSETFRQSWVQHFSDCAPLASLEKNAKIEAIQLTIEAAAISMDYKEWQTVRKGDCLLIGQSPFNPQTFEGNVHLTLNGRPIFDGIIKEGNLTVQELSLFQEVNVSMPKQDDPEDEDFSDFDLTEDDDDDEFISLDEDLFDDDEPEFIEDTPAKSSKDKTEENEDEEDERDNELTSEEKVETSAPSSALDETQELEPLIPIHKIPITVTVELARIKMPMDEFLQMEAGNLIEFHKNPQEPVNLSINGEVVARGELVMIGQSLGLRIEEVGH